MKHRVKYTPSNKVVAAKAPYQVADLIKEIQDTVYNVSAKYLKNEGWEMNDIADYFVTEVQEVEPGVIKAEIRGELDYEQLSELCSQLDKVVAIKFDKDAYFEPVEPGIAEAFIRTNVEACSDVTASGTNALTMQDVQALIDDYGTKYFEAIPTSGGRELWFSIFDVGGYNIRIKDGKIIMISTDDPYDDVRIFRNLDELRNYLEKQIAIGKQEADMNYSANASTLVTSSLNYVTPEMKQLKRALSKIYVDNDDQFHELVDSLLSNEPINLVPETRALKRAIDNMVVDSEEERRTLVYEVAKDLGVINSSSNVDVCCADAIHADSDDALWDVIDDEEFEFRGVQDVTYDNDDNIMVIFNHAISEDMIEPTAEELLTAFRQYGYPVHEWNTNGCNVFILSRGGILGSTTNASTYDDLDEELLDILDELSDMGYDIHDEADIKMGLGAGLGYDKQDQKLIMKDLRKRKIIASSVLARTKYVYIDHYNAFDNGKVLRNFQYMTEEQAQEAARQASIKYPTDAYYVHYDDVMNPGGDIVWVNGVAYRGMDVSPRGEGIAIRKGAQPVEVATASTEIKAHDFPESEDGWGTDVRGILDIPFARAEDLMYEIRNTIRGAYTDCETVEDLADYIRQLASEFEEAADELESL